MRWSAWTAPLRQTLRRLMHEWRYSVAVALILAVGIGPTAAMVSVFYDVLLRPLAYREPDRLGLLRISLGQLRNHPGLSPAEALDLRKAGVFESVETQTRLSEISLGAAPDLVPLSQLSFTSGMLPMLGVQPILGRNFTEADFPPPPPPLPPVVAGAPPAPPRAPPPLPPQKVLLDYGTWQTHFSGDRGVIGRSIQINGRASEVIGVLPNGFRLATGRAAPQRIDVYTPFPLRDFRNAWQFPTLARLKPGMTFEQAQVGLDRVSRTLKQDHADVYQGQLQFTVTPLLDDMTRATRPALRAAAAAVLLLFVIAFANATALVIARLKSRETDFAIRSALGASTRSLVAEVLMESAGLALAGAVIGGVLAIATVTGVREIIPRTVPRWDEIAVGWSQLAYAAFLTLAGLLILGLIPVWRISRGANFGALRSGSVQGGKAEGAVSRLVLVGAQMAFTVVLAFGCVQLARSAVRLRSVDLGYDPNVLTLRVPYDFQRFPSRKHRAELYQRIRDRVWQVPGVTAVGVVTHVPLSGSTMMDGYEADLSKEPSFEQSANYQAVSRGYFQALRIPLLQGRDFTDQEDADTLPVIIVDESLVRVVFPNEKNVIGRTLRLGWGLANARIVGVVGHARTIEAGRAVRPQIYAPIGNLFQNAGNVMVRASGDPRTLERAITAAILEVGPGRAVSGVAMLTDNVAAATSTLIAVTGLVTLLALSAGLLSVVGLYLVLAFVIHQRRRATAIRSALGATPSRVMWDNFRTSGLLMCVALPLGALGSLGAAAMLEDLVYGVASRDVLSLAAALGLAAVAGLLGTYFPVRRTGRANILSVLRET